MEQVARYEFMNIRVWKIVCEWLGMVVSNAGTLQ